MWLHHYSLEMYQKMQAPHAKVCAAAPARAVLRFQGGLWARLPRHRAAGGLCGVPGLHPALPGRPPPLPGRLCVQRPAVPRRVGDGGLCCGRRAAGRSTTGPALAAGRGPRAPSPAASAVPGDFLYRAPQEQEGRVGQAPPWASHPPPAPPASAGCCAPGPGAQEPPTSVFSRSSRPPVSGGPSPPPGGWGWRQWEGPARCPETFCPLQSVGAGK